jgi:hypothetical protein
MKLIDANVFLYSTGVEHEYKAPSARVLAMCDEGLLEATTDVEAIQEMTHILYSRRERSFGVEFIHEVLIAYPDAFSVTMSTINSAIDLMNRYPNLRSRDAIHAAVVFEHKLEGIISADRAFDGIAGLTRFDPKELAA